MAMEVCTALGSQYCCWGPGIRRSDRGGRKEAMPGRRRWGRVLRVDVGWRWCLWPTNLRRVLGKVGSLHKVVLEVALNLVLFLLLLK